MDFVRSLIAFILVALQQAYGKNVLYIAPVPSPSHDIWNSELGLALANKGYNVTMVSHYKYKTSLPENFHPILLEGMYEVLFKTFDMKKFGGETVFDNIKNIYSYNEFTCEYDSKTEGFQTLLNYPNDFKFDVILMDTAGGRCLYPFIKKFNDPPVIWTIPFLIPSFLNNEISGQHFTSYVPNFISKFSNKMNFGERFWNFVYTYLDVLYRDYVFLPRENAIIKEAFPGFDISLLEGIERNISLALCNHDPVTQYPRLLPPNVIPVGGLHVKPAKALPEDLQRITDSAENGVVVFSLGTNVKSSDLPSPVKQAFLNVFEQLPETVVWKYESDDLKDLPKNVHLRSWLPLNDMLGHPNTKLFISHGGALSLQESVYHGVPVIGIPFFCDQFGNMLKIEEEGAAKVMDKDNLTESVIAATTDQVLNDPKYSKNMKQLSEIYRHELHTPLERAIFWVERVLNHGSTGYLNLPSRDMSVFQTGNLDVYLVILSGIALVYAMFTLLITYSTVLFDIVKQCQKFKSVGDIPI